MKKKTLRKIMIIENCFDCSHCEVFGLEYHCRELGRRLMSKTGRIPKDCPLDDSFVYEEIMRSICLEQAYEEPPKGWEKK